jgi:hypothetical protein
MLGSWVPPMVVREDSGMLRFELSPHLNISDDNQEGFEGDRKWQISS